MNPNTDYTLTLVVLAPMVVAVAVAVAWRWHAPPPARRSRRLSDDELRRLYPITAERAGKFPA